jgi:flagellar biosynthesis/type III secretory pathway M-ring protein FliF/YscJ
MSEFFSKNKTLIFIFLAVIAVIIGVYFFIQIRNKRKEEEAQDQITNQVVDIIQELNKEDAPAKANFAGVEPETEPKFKSNNELVLEALGNFFSNNSRADEFPLVEGSQGKRVEQLQMHLAKYAKKNRGLDIDFIKERGKFGKQTAQWTFNILGLKEINEETFKENKMHENRLSDFPKN